MKKSFLKGLLTYLLWLTPAFILIVYVANGIASGGVSGKMRAIPAILLIIVFHFAAMYFIINSNRLKITEK